jgi:hypothetical protein
MITKFIEGTNEQYSVREDGVVLSHYRNRYSRVKNKYYIDYAVVEMTPNENNAVTILKKQRNVKSLLFVYFGYVFCKQCGCKSTNYLNKNLCKTCIRKNKNARKRQFFLKNLDEYKKRRREYRKKNPEAYAEMARKAAKKRSSNLVKNYVASSLNLSVKDLSDELYEHHKKLILFKRQVAKDLNINIEKLV